ncbi:Uncharacterised protein [Chlamydia trachomatis]|nr:Uncharacterised protein [Chlamydia trachomatis]
MKRRFSSGVIFVALLIYGQSSYVLLRQNIRKKYSDTPVKLNYNESRYCLGFIL